MMEYSFNPYRVFWFAATVRDVMAMLVTNKVSIPIGFSGSLQLEAAIAYNDAAKSFNPYRVFWFAATFSFGSGSGVVNSVSIPIGFSGSLQLEMINPITTNIEKFQSLSGFLVRCNDVYCFGGPTVSGFQSLSGFLVRCNIRSWLRTGPLQESFNPYRVFWFAATSAVQSRWRLRGAFQSLSGFLVRCNASASSGIAPL